MSDKQAPPDLEAQLRAAVEDLAEAAADLAGAVVEAYAAGKVELEAPPTSSMNRKMRYAPSFLIAHAPANVQSPYTGETVAAELRRMSRPEGPPARRCDA